jgi:hypothetical protein
VNRREFIKEWLKLAADLERARRFALDERRRQLGKCLPLTIILNSGDTQRCFGRAEARPVRSTLKLPTWSARTAPALARLPEWSPFHAATPTPRRRVLGQSSARHVASMRHGGLVSRSFAS